MTPQADGPAKAGHYRNGTPQDAYREQRDWLGDERTMGRTGR